MNATMKISWTAVVTAAVATAAAFTYPPYEYYTGTTSGTPALNYTKVCEPGRTGEANATYVVLGHCYPAKAALWRVVRYSHFWWNVDALLQGDALENPIVQRAFADADMILWLVEPTTFIGAGERNILEKLQKVRIPVVLCINKTDTVTTEQLAKCIDTYRAEMEFSDVVPVSAVQEKNLDELLKVLFAKLPEGPMFYDEDTVTEQPMRDIAAEMIREQALRLLRDEIPHGIAVTVESMKERENGIIDLEASIICERDSHKGMIIGKGGQMLKRIGTGARIAIEEMCEAKVNLKLWVKVRRDWRDDETQLKSFGYDARKLR